jgi:cytochrome c biogenesis protein CcmG, thiol:disulfide interchange protein DsbE
MGTQIRITPAGDTVERDIGAAETTPSKPDAAEAVRALPKVGSLAPDFSLRALDGTTVTLSALRGHPVLINFWTSWCVGCRQEAPELQQLFTEHEGDGLIILGLNATTEDDMSKVNAYATEFKLTYPIPLDEQGTAIRAYKVPGLPTSFFVDRHGIIRNVVMGQMDSKTMREGIALIEN